MTILITILIRSLVSLVAVRCIECLAIAEEKKELEHRKSIGEFDKNQLKRQNTQEKIVLPSKEAIAVEKHHCEHRNSIDSFNKAVLKPQSTEVKNTLPSATAINQEKQEVELRTSIGKYDRNSLKKADMIEKDGLNELIAQEATHKKIEKFSKDSLKHAETQEKNQLPTKEDIQAEKAKK